MPVGRLDFNSEGLLLLTNDGAVKRHLELPATGWTRRYRVRAHGVPDPQALAGLKHGVTVAGVRYGPIEASIERQQGSNCWLSMTLIEGKNREVRRVLEHLGLQVSRLIRIAYGPFQLGDLPPAACVEVPPKTLHEQLGKALPAIKKPRP
jgi:23S rRNA pseudouridine2605 synthase